jgi:hypothetical protein
MIRSVLSILAGVIAGAIAVAIIEVWLIYQLFDMPESMIPNDPESVAAHLEMIPTGAKWLVVISQFVGAYVASRVAGLISKGIRMAALTAGMIILVFTIMNLFSIAHPAWMTIAMPLAAIAGLMTGSKGLD